MFCHFGINTFAGKEITDGKVPPNVYSPPPEIAQKADEWVRFCRDAGMRYFICVTKHVDGFCMWDTKYTDYGISNKDVAVKTDIVKAISDACRKYGISFAVYYCMWDNHESTFKTPEKYKEFVKSQLTELLTNYGPVAEIWLDGSWIRPADDWHMPEIYDHIKRLQPDCQVTMNWTIGYPGKPDTHRIWPAKQQTGYPIRYWPCDFRIADPYLPKRDDPKTFTHNGKSYYMPFESTVTVAKNNQWFGFSGDQGAKSEDLLARIYTSATSNDNLLVLNIPPMQDGNLVPSQAQAVLNFTKRLHPSSTPAVNSSPSSSLPTP